MPADLVTRPYPPATRGTVVVWHLLASYPFGGMTWQALHHVAGLRRLGFDVWYVEDTDAYVLDPETDSPTLDHEPNVAWLSHHMDRIGLGDRWLYRAPTRPDLVYNGTPEQLAALYRNADAVLNVCGAQELREEHLDIGCLVYLQSDPVAQQVAIALGDERTVSQLDHYAHLFTYGETQFLPDSPVPMDRYTWQPTRPPVCVDWWTTEAEPAQDAALTTITNWTHGTDNDVVWQGERWRWRKDTAFMRFADLPARSPLPLELAVGRMREKDAEELRRRGWRLVPSKPLADPDAYRRYVQGSHGEWTATKEQYVRPLSGWFSDRSVCFLAAGRPVVTEDTGFSRVLPTGEGLFAYASADEAITALEAVAAEPDRQRAAAREVAEECFAAELVLGDMMRRVGLL